jgi:hypothetical protein
VVEPQRLVGPAYSGLAVALIISTLFLSGVSFSDFAIKRALLLGYQISMMDLR